MAEEVKPPVDIPIPRDVGKPFDATRQRWWIRTILAIGAFLLFSTVVLALLFAVIAGRPWSDLESAAGVLLPAVSAVTVGSLTFFFLTKSKE
jgi:hypothetical protein